MTTPDHFNSPIYPAIARSVLLALGVVAVIFIACEIVERVWLHDLDSQALHLFHLMRGLFTSLIAAVLVGWFLVKTSPSLFSTSLLSDGLSKVQKPDNLERLDNFNRWFILMRWIAVLVALLLTFLIVKVASWLPAEVWWPLVITISSLAILNLIYEFLYYRGLFKSWLLSFQAYADLIILSILLHFSGGIENPLSVLMLIHVIIAGIVLNRKHCYAIAASASILLAMIAAGEASGFISHYTLTIFPHVVHDGHLAHASHQPVYVISYISLISVIFFLTAYFVTTLADRIRQSERQLEKFAIQADEQRQLIEKALETTLTGLCVCDDQSVPHWTNRHWDKWFGKKTLDTFAKDHQIETDLPTCSDIRNGEMKVSEITLFGNGTGSQPRVIRITATPLCGKDGRPDQVVSLAQDITDQKKANAQLIHASKLAAVGKLAGHVAHEVNNPIGIISAKCRLLIDDHSDELSPKVREEIIKVIAAADRVAHIAKGLLSYCRPSPAKRSELDVRTPIQEAIAMIAQRAKKMGIAIEVRSTQNLPTISGNGSELQQVFLNLFLNALDAMPDGGTLTISVQYPEMIDEDNGQLLSVTIHDSGTGIPDDLINQVFEPFFTTKEEGKGTGLGLSICAGLIRSHGGTIGIQTGHGTSIHIQLPVIAQSTDVSS